jgi:ParB-like chromosome segregation protein Spo0J
MMYEQINTEEIKLPNWSMKNIDEESFKKLKKSIEKLGQTKNIIVRLLEDHTYEVIDGKVVFRILQEMKVDFIYCYVFKNITKTEAKRIYLEQDHYFENNFVEVGAAIAKITKKHSAIDVEKTLAYNYGQIEELLNLQNFDFSKYAPIAKAQQDTLL